ncbi:MAG TPA: hypothetical protein VFH51_16235, partial [Myxococcota bacterium]|nr:hypothetical protein [Myxococcota bacterium]
MARPTCVLPLCALTALAFTACSVRQGPSPDETLPEASLPGFAFFAVTPLQPDAPSTQRVVAVVTSTRPDFCTLLSQNKLPKSSNAIAVLALAGSQTAPDDADEAFGNFLIPDSAQATRMELNERCEGNTDIAPAGSLQIKHLDRDA